MDVEAAEQEASEAVKEYTIGALIGVGIGLLLPWWAAVIIGGGLLLLVVKGIES